MRLHPVGELLEADLSAEPDIAAALRNRPTIGTARDAATKNNAAEIRLDDYRWPGATYTWGELKQGANFDEAKTSVVVLRYARFVGYPLLALIILFMAQAKSGRETEQHRPSRRWPVTPFDP